MSAICLNRSDGSEAEYMRAVALAADFEVVEVPPGDPLVGRELPGGRVIVTCSVPSHYRPKEPPAPPSPAPCPHGETGYCGACHASFYP